MGFKMNGIRESDRLCFLKTLNASGTPIFVVQANGAPFTPEYSSDCHLDAYAARDFAFELLDQAEHMITRLALDDLKKRSASNAKTV